MHREARSWRMMWPRTNWYRAAPEMHHFCFPTEVMLAVGTSHDDSMLHATGTLTMVRWS